MKAKGRKTAYDEDRIWAAIRDYETSDKSWVETAEAWEIPKTVLQYHRRKAKEAEKFGETSNH